MIDKIFKKEKGLLAIFTDSETLVNAVRKTREMGLRKFDAFTPFPIHGMEHAMGLSRSPIPWFTLLFGLTGLILLFSFQVWTSAYDWPINVGGKPFISWPAFIPITFEGMVLIGGVGTVLTLFAFMRIPNYFHKPMDPRLTDDHFGLFIDETDPNFDQARINQLLQDCHAHEIKNIA